MSAAEPPQPPPPPPESACWQTARVAAYVARHGFSRVTLQFPDDLLHVAAGVADRVQRALAQHDPQAKVYLLADTSYNPLSVDEVAAAHVNADCIVHYGYASLHPVSRTPALCVLPQLPLDVQHCSSWLVEQLAALHPQQPHEQEQQTCVVCCDQGYLHHLPELQTAVQQAYAGPLQLLFAHSAPTELWPQDSVQDSSSSSSEEGSQQPAQVPTGGLLWQLPCGHNNSSSSSGDGGDRRCTQPLMVWLGPTTSPALTHLQLSFADHTWLLLHPVSQAVTQGLSAGLDRLLKRRYYLVERARGAAMIGLLVGTLGAAGYKTALEQLRQLAAKAGRKTYTLLMGKPNPAKLANFPEIEVFVMLADPQGLILDSKEYLSPIISPHEAFLALTGRPFEPAAYRLDFGDLLQLAGPPQGEGPGEQQQQQRRSAAAAAELGGDISSIIDGEQFPSDGNDEQLAAAVGTLVIAGGGSKILQHSGAGGKQVQVRSAAQYLVQERTYRGLETPAVGAEALPASLVVEGRSGRAAGYVDEPTVG